MRQALQIRVRRWLKSTFPDGDTNAVVSALQEIKSNTDQGRAYRRQILACYSRTKQAEIQEDFLAAVETLLLEYQGRTQLSIFVQGGAA